MLVGESFPVVCHSFPRVSAARLSIQPWSYASAVYGNAEDGLGRNPERWLADSRTQRFCARTISSAVADVRLFLAMGMKYSPRIPAPSEILLLAARYIAVAAPSSVLCPKMETNFLISQPIRLPKYSFQTSICSVAIFPGKKALT